MVVAGLSLEGVIRNLGGRQVLRGVDLEVGTGTRLALLGPSGCGKTTLLRVIAGLDPLDGGTVAVDGKVVSSVTETVPPERRGMGMVFQDGALFPHLNVTQNVGFGLDRPDRRGGPRVEQMLDLVGLSGYGSRPVGELSGGEAQRVALARALAPSPAALLLDEPFSNLDTPRRAHLRVELGRMLGDAGVTAIIVTHDRADAFALGQRVAVMNEGRIVQVGTPGEIYRQPVDGWVAALVGDVEIVEGRLGAGGVAETRLGAVPVRGSEGVPVGTAVRVSVRPEDIAIDASTDPRAGGLLAVVVGVHLEGPTCLVELDAEGGRVRCRTFGEPTVRPGDQVRATHRGESAVLL